MDPAVRTVAGTAAPVRLEVLAGGRADPREAVVVDLGSNSWRLVVFQYVPGGWWRRTGQIQEPVRIGEGIESTGVLSKAAIRRGLETLEIFGRYCAARGIGAESIDVVATSAIREAANREEFLVRARRAGGMPIRVLSVEEEAHAAYVAAVNSTSLTDGLVLDLGGGSLQLVGVEDRLAYRLESWPLGAVRVTERLLPGAGPVSRKRLAKARAQLRRELASAAWAADAGRRLVGVGGAVRNLAAAAHGAGADIQGTELRARDLAGLVEEMAARPVARRALPGIKPARADIVLAAALVLEAVVDVGGFKALEVTRAGLREGVFIQRRLLAGAPPLLADVRGASVRNLAAACGADAGHADQVAALAVGLHDSLADLGVIAPEACERDVLHAGAYLHDIGMAIGHDGYPEHSEYLVRRSGLPGFTPQERERIARVVRHHRKGVPAGDAVVARCALLVRVAEQLDRGHGGLVRGARFERDGRALALRIEGDAALARWSLERCVSPDAFRRVFGRRLKL